MGYRCQVLMVSPGWCFALEGQGDTGGAEGGVG